MKFLSPSRRLILAFGLVAMGIIATIVLVPRPTAAPSAQVAVTSYPLLDLVRMIVGPDVRVAVILPPGGNPHTFEPTPATLATLRDAQVVYAVGHGFDDWVDGLLTEGGAEKVVVDAGIALRETAEHAADEEGGAEDEDEHGPVDPHYWLDARNAAQIARNVAADMTARQPQHAAAIAENLAAAEATLLAADDRIRGILSGATNRNIVTLHDAWYYFADAYGLTVLGTFEPTAGREPSPQQLAALERTVRAAGSTTLYREPGLPSSGIEAFAADNDLTIVDLDTVEGASDDGYVAAMLRNAEAIRDNQ